MSLDEIVQNVTETLRQNFREDVRNILKEMLPGMKVRQPDEIEWLRPQQARELLGLSSRKFWKQLRASGEVHYTKIGKEYQYSRSSLSDYKTKRSSIRYEIGPVKKMKSRTY